MYRESFGFVPTALSLVIDVVSFSPNIIIWIVEPRNWWRYLKSFDFAFSLLAAVVSFTQTIGLSKPWGRAVDFVFFGPDEFLEIVFFLTLC